MADTDKQFVIHIDTLKKLTCDAGIRWSLDLLDELEKWIKDNKDPTEYIFHKRNELTKGTDLNIDPPQFN